MTLSACALSSDPFVPRNKPYRVRGLYLDGEQEVHWHVEVDQDILRGSGRPVPQEVGTFLGLSARRRIDRTDEPQSILSQFRGRLSSIVGPSIGSLRAHAEAVTANIGDVLRLTFIADSLSVMVLRVPPAQPDELPAMRLHRLTGLKPVQALGISEIASAVGAARGDLVEVLRKRGDDAVADVAEQLFEA